MYTAVGEEGDVTTSPLLAELANGTTPPVLLTTTQLNSEKYNTSHQLRTLNVSLGPGFDHHRPLLRTVQRNVFFCTELV